MMCSGSFPEEKSCRELDHLLGWKSPIRVGWQAIKLAIDSRGAKEMHEKQWRLGKSGAISGLLQGHGEMGEVSQ